MHHFLKTGYKNGSGLSIRCESQQQKTAGHEKTQSVSMRQDMNNSNQRHTKLLAAMAIFGICILTTSAQACLSYKNTQEQTKLWGLPEENTSSVQAVLPAQARVCIDEQLPGPGGEEWARVSFYILDDVRYSARGWVNIERFTNTTKGEPPTPAATLATTPATALQLLPQLRCPPQVKCHQRNLIKTRSQPRRPIAMMTP